MVEPVALLLNGRGHPVVRAREAGLADEDDAIVSEYAEVSGLVVVTFDPDFRAAVLRRGGRCLHIRPPERSARERLAEHYRDVVAHFAARRRLVTLPSQGKPRVDRGRRGTA